MKDFYKTNYLLSTDNSDNDGVTSIDIKELSNYANKISERMDEYGEIRDDISASFKQYVTVLSNISQIHDTIDLDPQVSIKKIKDRINHLYGHQSDQKK